MSGKIARLRSHEPVTGLAAKRRQRLSNARADAETLLTFGAAGERPSLTLSLSLSLLITRTGGEGRNLSPTPLKTRFLTLGLRGGGNKAIARTEVAASASKTRH